MNCPHCGVPLTGMNSNPDECLHAPRTLRELLTNHELQKSLYYECKCGWVDNSYALWVEHVADLAAGTPEQRCPECYGTRKHRNMTQGDSPQECANTFHAALRAATPPQSMQEPISEPLEQKSKEELLVILRAAYEDEEYFRTRSNYLANLADIKIHLHANTYTPPFLAGWERGVHDYREAIRILAAQSDRAALAAATPDDEQKRQSDEVHEAYLGKDRPNPVKEILDDCRCDLEVGYLCDEHAKEKLIHDVSDWLTERNENCLRLAGQKPEKDRKGWLEDARYFEIAIKLLAAQRDTQEKKP